MVRAVRVSNFKSLKSCSIEMSPLTLLVGRNGAGKSNVVDILRFVKEGLTQTLDAAVASRGGVKDVWPRQHSGRPPKLSIGIDLVPTPLTTAEYEIVLRRTGDGRFDIDRESLKVVDHSRSRSVDLGGSFEYQRLKKKITSTVDLLPTPSPDRLQLVGFSGHEVFRPTYDALTNCGFYSVSPVLIREFQPPASGELLRRDGSNLASAIRLLSQRSPETVARITQYLETVVPGITAFRHREAGRQETVEFDQRSEHEGKPWTFDAYSMSDGTLRTLANLVAMFQLTPDGRPVRLAALDEPETALHPAAAAPLFDAITEASQKTQVVVSTHDPILLDLYRAEDERQRLLVVESQQGATTVSEPDEAMRDAIRNHLVSAGEMLRQDLFGNPVVDIGAGQ